MKKTISLLISIVTILVLTSFHTNAKAQSTTQWENIIGPDQPEARYYHSMVYDSYRHVVVMTGGEYIWQYSDTYEYSSEGWEKKNPEHVPPILGTLAYDSLHNKTVLVSHGETWTWNGIDWKKENPEHNPPITSTGMSMAFDELRGVVVLYGGYDSYYGQSYATWVWDGEDWTVKTPPAGQPSPTVCCDAAMAYDSSRDVVVLYGGQWGGLGTYTNQTWEWNGSEWNQVFTVGNPPDALIDANMIFDINRQRMILFGGASFDVPNWHHIFYNDVWEYDAAIKTWALRDTTNPPEERYLSAMAYDSDRGVSVMFGGVDYSNGETHALSDTWEWDGNTGTWLNTFSPRNPLYYNGASFSYDPIRGQGLLIGGGVNPQGPDANSDTWLWKSFEGKWIQIRYTSGGGSEHPPARIGPSNSYFGATGETIVFGGWDTQSNALNDTWAWKGETHEWHKLTPQDSPSPRAGASLAYDSQRNVLVLFGGTNGISNNETWEWYDNNWHQVHPQHTPDAGYWPMAFDSTRNVMVLITWDWTAIVKTWEFINDDWILRDPAIKPTQEYGGSMVYDPVHRVTVLVGGTGDSHWEWNGENWNDTGNRGEPVSFKGESMIYDTVRKSLIVYSGLSTWEYKNSSDDILPPTTTITLNPANPDGQNGWYVSPVLITAAATDNPGGSGVAETRCVLDPVSNPSSIDEILNGCDYGGDGAEVAIDFQHTIYAASVDNAGNKENVISQSFKLDKTPPQLNPIITPNPIILNGMAAVDPRATDNLSGIAWQRCDPVDTGTVGTKTVVCTAMDNAGNLASQAVTYQVNYHFDGFLQPINDTAHQTCQGCPTSIFKGNSTVPVKFQLKDANGSIVHTVNPPIWITPIQGGPTSQPVDESVYSDPASSGNIYNLNGDHYAYNWKTKGYATGYYWRIGVQLDDGHTYYVYIGLR